MNNNLALNCPHFPQCSGCCLSQDVCAPPILLEAKQYFAQLDYSDLKINVGSPTGWRCRAKLAVRGSSNSPKIGLFKQGTHDVLDIPCCQMHHPQINRGAEILRKWIRQESIMPYNETTFSGTLRYVQLVVERSTKRIQASLVVNQAPDSRQLQGKLQKLGEMGWPDLWHSLWLNYNTRRDNVIFGQDWELYKGDELLWETLAGTAMCFQPANFAQANLDLFEKMLTAIRSFVPQGAKVAEFYAGVGAIGLSLAAQCKWVRCGEVNPHASYCFERSRERLPSEIASRITWQQGKASAQAVLLEGADIAIVDPPRQGLEPVIIKLLNSESSVRQLIYVSCGWQSFQRDAERLLADGWKLKAAEGYLFFPGSDHIETLAVFEKESG